MAVNDITVIPGFHHLHILQSLSLGHGQFLPSGFYSQSGHMTSEDLLVRENASQVSQNKIALIDMDDGRELLQKID